MGEKQGNSKNKSSGVMILVAIITALGAVVSAWITTFGVKPPIDSLPIEPPSSPNKPCCDLNGIYSYFNSGGYAEVVQKNKDVSIYLRWAAKKGWTYEIKAKFEGNYLVGKWSFYQGDNWHYFRARVRPSDGSIDFEGSQDFGTNISKVVLFR